MKTFFFTLALSLPASAAVVDINTAGAPELARNLLGVGPAIAGRIVEYRTIHGGFPTPDSIQLVPGVGEKTYLRNRQFIQASPLADEGPTMPSPADQGVTP